jgi:hypothetical protein
MEVPLTLKRLLACPEIDAVDREHASDNSQALPSLLPNLRWQTTAVCCLLLILVGSSSSFLHFQLPSARTPESNRQRAATRLLLLPARWAK